VEMLEASRGEAMSMLIVARRWKNGKPPWPGWRAEKDGVGMPTERFVRGRETRVVVAWEHG
jgi:hypothetical protein